MLSKPNDIPVPGVGRYVPTPYYRVLARTFVEGSPVTYTASFACIPCLEGVAAMVQCAADHMEKMVAELTADGHIEVVKVLRPRIEGYRRLVNLILAEDAWPASVNQGVAILQLGHPGGSVSVNVEYSWSLHNA